VIAPAITAYEAEMPQLANIGPTTRRPAGPPSALAVITEHMQGLQASGEVRDDVPAETIGRFLGLLVDGIGLQTSAGFPVDVEPLLVLIRDAIAPRK